MPARTLGEARRRLEELAPGLNPEAFRQLEAEIDKASGAALARASEYADKAVGGVLHGYEQELQERAALRDEALALVAMATSGTADSRAVNRELQRLRALARNRSGHLAEVERTLALVESVESDPEVWYDDLANRIPSMRIEFSW